MIERRPDQAIRRIILALDATQGSGAMLSAATALAARLEAELEAVFLEDEDLLRSAALPFVRRINLLSATAETFDAAATERELKLLAGQLRRTLAAEAGRMKVPWSFRVVRGRAETEVPAAAKGCDLVVFARTGEGAGPYMRGGWALRAAAVHCPGPVMLLPGRAPDMAGPVVALYDGGNSENVLRLAARLADVQAQPLIVLAAAGTPAAAAELAERAKIWLETRQIAAEVRAAVANSVDRLIELVRACRGREEGGTMVVDATARLMQDSGSIMALERLEGAVLLVRQ